MDILNEILQWATLFILFVSIRALGKAVDKILDNLDVIVGIDTKSK